MNSSLTQTFECTKSLYTLDHQNLSYNIFTLLFTPFTIIPIVGSCALNVLLKHNALNVRKNEMLVNSTVNVINKRTFNAQNNSNALYVLFPKN